MVSVSPSARLRALAAKATPGPWEVRRDGVRQRENRYLIAVPHRIPASTFAPNARLIALAPELATLCADMADFIRGDTPDDECEVPGCPSPWECDHDAEALLARFADLEEKA